MYFDVAPCSLIRLYSAIASSAADTAFGQERERCGSGSLAGADSVKGRIQEASVRNLLSVAILATAISSVWGLGAAWGQTPQPKKPEWKDRAEYDLEQSAENEKDPKKKLDLLNQWKQNYPNTDYRMLRLDHYLATYRVLQDGAKILETAQEMLKEIPSTSPGCTGRASWLTATPRQRDWISERKPPTRCSAISTSSSPRTRSRPAPRMPPGSRPGPTWRPWPIGRWAG